MKLRNILPGALLAAAALAAAAPVFAQRDYRYDERYEQERYDDDGYRSERYEDERYENESLEGERYDDERYERYEEPAPQYAKVIDVDPIVDVESRPVERQECRQEPVARREQTPRAGAPAITPGIVGAVLGQPSTTGRTAAIAGASTGTARVPATTRRCTTRTEYVEQERITGYDVAYRYRGRTYYTVTARDPGDKIRIRLD